MIKGSMMSRFGDFLKKKDIEISLKRYGIDALGVIGAHRAEDHGVNGVGYRVDAQVRVVAEHEGTDVQAGAHLVGDPVRVHLDDGLQDLQGAFLIQHGQAHPAGGVVHPADVLHRTEQLHAAIGKTVGGTFGQTIGGNLGAQLGRSILGTLFKS